MCTLDMCIHDCLYTWLTRYISNVAQLWFKTVCVHTTLHKNYTYVMILKFINFIPVQLTFNIDNNLGDIPLHELYLQGLKHESVRIVGVYRIPNRLHVLIPQLSAETHVLNVVLRLIHDPLQQPAGVIDVVCSLLRRHRAALFLGQPLRLLRPFISHIDLLRFRFGTVFRAEVFFGGRLSQAGFCGSGYVVLCWVIGVIRGNVVHLRDFLPGELNSQWPETRRSLSTD